METSQRRAHDVQHMHCISAVAVCMAVGNSRPHILQIVADDLGYDDLGHQSVMGNGGLSISPNINRLMDTGIILTDYYTFKVCSPSRASLLTGRYPWGAGFYDMSTDDDHCTAKYVLLPALLKNIGYRTVALGKWDVGFWHEECTPTFSGFDTFLGYYEACLSDYWYHWGPNQCDERGPYVDLSNSTLNRTSPSSLGLNGTYNAHIFTARAIEEIDAIAVDRDTPRYIYLAYQNVHLACGNAPRNVNVASGKPHGLQAPCSSVDLYPNATTDTVKLQGAMITELDYGVGNVSAALASAAGDNYVVFMVSDNGAQMDHGYNAPHRGGKHTFWEGGLRVVCWINSPLFPEARRGTLWNGLAHSSDWYATLVEGVARGPAVNSSRTGPREPDGFNLWPAIMTGGPSPRNEVVHQVSNMFYDADTGISYDGEGNEASKGNGDGSLGSAIRVGKYKLIVGDPGNHDIVEWPRPGPSPTQFGKTGGFREPGTDHCRSVDGHQNKYKNSTYLYLYDLESDPTEESNLAADPAFMNTVMRLRSRLTAVGAAQAFPAAYLYFSKDDIEAAASRVCSKMQKSGFLEPGGPATPAPPAPAPSPSPDGPASQVCAAAGGILGKDDACCASSCGTCGGHNCRRKPGGAEDCCTNQIITAGVRCDATHRAPCLA